MRILIVDDSKVMRMIVRRTLRQAGFEGHDVREAANGRDALEQVCDEEPHIILADWNMPEMSGIELLEGLRERGIHTRFGFVTTESSPEMRRRAAAAGAAFLLCKPFSAEALRAVLGPLMRTNSAASGVH